MAGTLYTSYFYRFVHKKDVLDKNDVTIIIARQLQDWIPKELFNKHMKDLAPSTDLRYEYKDGKIDDNEFRAEYIKEIYSSSKGKMCIEEIKSILDSGKNVYIYCYESDFRKCHRLPLAEIINAYGYAVVLR